MPIQFDQTLLYNFTPNQTVEFAYRNYAAWSGIHDFQFNALLSEASKEVTSGGAWAGVYLYPDLYPSDIEITYSITGSGHGVILRAEDTDNYLIVGCTATHFTVIERIGGSNTTRLALPLDITPSSADVRVVYREMRYTDDLRDLWDSVSMWINDRLVGTWAQKRDTELNTDYKIGLAVENGSRTFTNIRVPQLTEFAEWSSIDPGESPMGGLQRAIEGRYTRFYMRYNGALRAWRPDVTSSAFTFTNDEIYDRTQSFDRRQMATHVRMLGAYTQADALRYDLLAQYGYRFIEQNNPFLMSAPAAQREAGREIQRMEERAEVEEFSTQFVPTLEPEDHIETPNGDFIVEKITWAATRTSSVMQSLACRKYVLGS